MSIAYTLLIDCVQSTCYAAIMSKWNDYVRARMEARDWDAATLSKRTNLNPSTISRWFTKGVDPSVDNIRKIAEAFGAPVVEAMLAAGALTEEELQVKIVAPDPDLLTDEEVLWQVTKRMGSDREPCE